MVVDLDGTLLFDAADTPSPSEWTRRSGLVARLKHKGVKLTVATGRTYAGARAAIDLVCTNAKTPVVLCNGSVVMDCMGNLLAFESIPRPAIDHVARLLNQQGGQAFVYFVSPSKGFTQAQESVYYVGSATAPDREFNGMVVSPGLPDADSLAAVAMLIVAPKDRDPNALFASLSAVPEISLTRSGAAYIEVRPADSTKAKGLARALPALGLSRDRVMAIGDNDNDVEMLELCGLAVSVANASPKAKAASNYVTTLNSAHGVVEVLDLLRRVKRLSQGGVQDGRHKRKT